MLNESLRNFIFKHRLLFAMYMFIRGKREEFRFYLRCVNLRRNGRYVLKQVHDVLTSAGLPYFADWGTLLGCVRDHKFIRHDDDIDYGLPVGCKNLFAYHEVLSKIPGFKFKYAFEWHGWIQQIVYTYKGIDIDFFAGYTTDDGMYSQAYTRHDYVKYEKMNQWTPHRFKTCDLGRIEAVAFEKTLINIPANYKELLTLEYGNWETPVKGFHGNAQEGKLGQAPREELYNDPCLVVDEARVRELGANI